MNLSDFVEAADQIEQEIKLCEQRPAAQAFDEAICEEKCQGMLVTGKRKTQR